MTIPANKDYRVWRALLKGKPLPAAVVDLSAFDRNVASIAKLVQERNSQVRVRIASKSVRVPALLRRILDFGSPYQGLMCYSAREACFLAEQGFDDFLVAYPTVQKEDLRALGELHAKQKKVSLIVDSKAGLSALNAAVGPQSNLFSFMIEHDLSLRLLGNHLGVRRSPIRTVPQVRALVQFASTDCPNLRFVGLMGYEAQVAGLGDRNPFKGLMNFPAKLVRSISVKKTKKIRAEFSQAFPKIEIYNGGGTGSLSYAAEESWLTELSAGSGFICSHLFDYYSNLNLEAAGFFALEVVRSSDPHFYTCQGGGYIASGEMGNDRAPRPVFPLDSKLVSMEGCGEVQTPIRSAVDLKLGDPVLFRHAKAGELAERFNHYWLFGEGDDVERVSTYRGLGQCFF